MFGQNTKHEMMEKTYVYFDILSSMSPFELRYKRRFRIREDSGNATESVLPTAVDHGDDPINAEDRELSYIFVPICALGLVIVLTIGVLMFIQRKRRIDRLRHRLMPFYNFAPGEEEDWEAELLESEGELTVKRV
ncbi:hypothetical protein AAG570_012355 [Ranatra chinensis]|uniref:Small integral membrane protein 29 n=1 Tax=Ranatra chinensis TaxID=642074 RepID=A0ABD0YIL1_9HEMI